jgi:multidrug resistance protein MdtO
MTSRADPLPPASALGAVEGFIEFLKSELRPRPGRLAFAFRIAALTVAVVIISETFRIPLPAYSAYIVFFASKEETTSTTLTGIVLTICASAAVLSALAIYMISAAEPGLRLPLMVLVAFASLFLSRVSPLGTAAFAIGFVTTIALTLIDVVSPLGVMPGSEILTQTVLWLWVVAMLPIGLVVAVNLVTGRTPSDLFRQAMTSRLMAAGRLLLGESAHDADMVNRLTAIIRSDVGDLLRYQKLSSIQHKRSPRQTAANQALVARTHEVMTLVNEWMALDVATLSLRDAAAGCGQVLLAVARSMETGADFSMTRPRPSLDDMAWRDQPPAALVLGRLIDVVDHFPELMVERHAADREEPENRPTEAKHRQLLVEDAFSNPEHVRFALKTTLAIILAYVTYNFLDWPGIRTAMITCFFVTLGNVGETFHKMTLRIVGCLIGGALGLGTIVFLMPVMTSITDLCLAIGAVSLVAAWISTSSDRLSYVGMQIAMAYFFCVLVGYGPTIDLTEPRDRVIGILLGNTIVALVFTNIWPVSAIAHAREALAGAIRKLADVFLLTPSEAGTLPSSADAAVFAFDAAVAEVRRLLTFDPFEPRAVKDEPMVEAGDVNSVQFLLGPALVLNGGGSGAAIAYRAALGAWLSRLAELAAIGKAGRALDPPPDVTAVIAGMERAEANPKVLAQAAWFGELGKRVSALDGFARRRLAVVDGEGGATP